MCVSSKVRCRACFRSVAGVGWQLKYRRKELTVSNLDPNLAPSFGHVPDFEEAERARRGLIEDEPPVGEPDPDDD
jgi:hypothetical protein